MFARMFDELVAAAVQWGSMSVAKVEAAIDYWVDRYDPYAVRRIEHSARGRHVEVVDAGNGSGVAYVEATVFSHDGAALDQRLDAMARTVCEADPRTLEQRRSDALGVLGHGGDRLACLCDNPDCDAAESAPSAAVSRAATNPPTAAIWTPPFRIRAGPTCASNLKCLCRKHRIHSRYEETTVKRCQSPGTPLSS